MKGRC